MSAKPVPLKVGDIIRLKKPHPCGGHHWEITRTGMDLGIHCLGCGRRVMVPRANLERRIKEVLSPEDLPEEVRRRLLRRPAKES
ncbi:MAG: DUF951 domain-containing protein [Bacillota bacterium]